MSAAILSMLSSFGSGAPPELDSFVTVGSGSGVIGFLGGPIPAVGAIDPDPANFLGKQVIAAYSDAGDAHTWSLGVLDPVGIPDGTRINFELGAGSLTVFTGPGGGGNFGGLPPVVSHGDFGTVGTTFYHWTNPDPFPLAWGAGDVGADREVFISL